MEARQLRPNSIHDLPTTRRKGGGATVTDWSNCPVVECVSSRISGDWAFAGTRVPACALFENLGCGATVKEFLEWYPEVKKWQVTVVLKHQAESLRTAARARALFFAAGSGSSSTAPCGALHGSLRAERMGVAGTRESAPSGRMGGLGCHGNRGPMYAPPARPGRQRSRPCRACFRGVATRVVPRERDSRSHRGSATGSRIRSPDLGIGDEQLTTGVYECGLTGRVCTALETGHLCAGPDTVSSGQLTMDCCQESGAWLFCAWQWRRLA